MMWLVRLALKRPYTFVVMSMLIALLGAITILRMPTDIFPDIDIPVISVVWSYSGHVAGGDGEAHRQQLRARPHHHGQRHRAHREPVAHRHRRSSRSSSSPAPRSRRPRRRSRRSRRPPCARCRPGTTPPFIIRYSASNVPILQLALESDTLSEQQLFDYGTNFIRADVATIQGAQIPWPYGGKQREIMIDIDPQRLFAWGLSPTRRQ